ncbi:MAG: M28 family peptidase [Saprospiraceae bacterium]|nr:M28 family peptidase [Saprospiraceae bacterium]
MVFIWFCGEEKGLLGSKYYSENPIFPLEKTVVDINVDMVGRSDEKYKDNPDYIYVIGSDRLSTDLHKVNEDVNQKYTQLTLDYTYNNEDDPNQFYYRSDHYNFARLGIPSIFYFSGTHEDYHRTSDDVDKINFDKMANVGKLIFHTMWEIANRKDGIVPDKVKK